MFMSEENLTSRGILTLEPGTLWLKIKQCSERALACGALHPIPTESEFVEEAGIRFLVRLLSNLARKEEAKKKQEEKRATSGKDFNPFLPYDKDLFVADISETHVCLLNKFNVVDYHLLLVTREFEEQEMLLNLQDFAAMWAVLKEFDGLAFYNGGKLAGASQRHKHLQLVPLPLVANGLRFPVEEALSKAVFLGAIANVPIFPFQHALSRLELQEKSIMEAAKITLECYYNLLRAVGLLTGNVESNSKQSGAYNLLATREWMLIIPRAQESFESIPINSLGFAGTLFIRNEQQLQILKKYGPLTVLTNVAYKKIRS